ncbi:MAG: lipoate--protein ligase family protein [Acidobacteria bacterium]|nr:lipoate--protein ligase family protein [Acidobacteriota bacterium]
MSPGRLDPAAGLTVFEAFGGAVVVSLAFEEELLALAAAGRPALSVSSWTGPVALLGYGQPASDIDLEACRARGIPVLRRITGGTGVILAGDLAVSLALPADHPWAATIGGLYDRFLDALAEALALRGAAVERPAPRQAAGRQRSPICFEDQMADTLSVDGRKVAGCAQARRKSSVLIHAAVLLGLDAGLYETIFGVSTERIQAALAPAGPDLHPRELGEAVTHTLAGALGLAPQPRRRPPVAAQFLDRYRTPRWAPVPPS